MFFVIFYCSKLPLSVLIVGVGDADFSDMRTLDGDEIRLEYDGVKAERDIVQFVPLNEVINLSKREIAKELLDEIPTQLLEYMKSKNIEPNKPTRHPSSVSDSNLSNPSLPSSQPNPPPPPSIPVPLPYANRMNPEGI